MPTGARAPYQPSGLRAAIVPVGSLLLLLATVGLVCASAGKTFGYDFEAYVAAARRIAAGQPLYDPNVSVAGGFAIYLYPPPFALALVPLTWLPAAAAKALWAIVVAACLPVGAMLLPIRRDLRWVLIILAAINWPFLYSVKLGQVGPLLFVLFAVAWRWSERPSILGTSIAAGALVKVQPALLAIWALVAGRGRAVWIAAGVAVAVAVVTTAFLGIGVWADYLSLLGRVSDAVTTPHNFSLGAVAYRAGVSGPVANAIQTASTVAVLGALLLVWRHGSPVSGFMAAVVASQLLTPLLWDHYAVLLFLPVAWLMDRGRIWAALLPIAGWASLFANQGQVGPSATVPLVFFVCLIAVVFEGVLERRSSPDAMPDLRRASGVAPGL